MLEKLYFIKIKMIYSYLCPSVVIMCLLQNILSTQKYVNHQKTERLFTICYIHNHIWDFLQCIDCTFADVRKRTRNLEISCISSVCFNLCTLEMTLFFKLIFFTETSSLCKIWTSLKTEDSHLPSQFLNSLNSVHDLYQAIKISFGFL